MDVLFRFTGSAITIFYEDNKFLISCYYEHSYILFYLSVVNDYNVFGLKVEERQTCLFW